MVRRPILAVGADIKNKFLLESGGKFFYGPSLGDLSDADNYRKFKESIRRIITSHKISPEIIACDLHPAYFSSKFAEDFKNTKKHSCSLVRVQHHHAHIASVMSEHSIKEPVIGVSFDGTGFGSDNNIWGGEFLIACRADFKRIAHLKYIPMPGSEIAVRQPWRMVLSILGKQGYSSLRGVRDIDKDVVLAMISKGINSPLTSSAGRLFDAAAALLGICVSAKFEAEGPIKLERLCRQGIDDRYDFDIQRRVGTFVIDTEPTFKGMIGDLKKRRDISVIATKFHNSISELIVATVKRIKRATEIKSVVLSGGVFQNKYLKERSLSRIENAGFKVFLNRTESPGDLNIAMGQYYVSCYSGKN